MISDDHEIQNDFIRNQTFLDDNNFDRFWAIQARYVYMQYGRQLREDIIFENANVVQTKPEYFGDILIKVGFYFSDFRNNKLFYNKTDNSYFGINQTSYIKTLLSPTGLFNSVNLLFVVSSVPLVVLNRVLLTKFYFPLNLDYSELIAYNNTEELENLLDDFRVWKGNNRKVFFIGGDQHVSFHTDIYYKKRPLFKQLVSSGIKIERYNTTNIFMVNNTLSMFQSLDRDYCFIHKSWTGNFNYAILKVNKTDTVPYEVDASVIISDGETIFQGDTHSSLESSGRELTCCGSDCNIDYVKILLSKLYMSRK